MKNVTVSPPTLVIDLRISNAIVMVKKGEARIGGYMLAKATERQPNSRSHLIIHP